MPMEGCALRCFQLSNRLTADATALLRLPYVIAVSNGLRRSGALQALGQSADCRDVLY
jgi:hypothetical protein